MVTHSSRKSYACIFKEMINGEKSPCLRAILGTDTAVSTQIVCTQMLERLARRLDRHRRFPFHVRINLTESLANSVYRKTAKTLSSPPHDQCATRWAQLSSYTGYAPFAGHGDISTIRLAQADSLPHIGLDTTGGQLSSRGLLCRDDLCLGDARDQTCQVWP